MSGLSGSAEDGLNRMHDPGEAPKKVFRFPATQTREKEASFKAEAAARYSIRLASRMSGISPHTLRMWERRYGYPAPQRTSGGARRYTEDDVDTLRLVAQALETGYRAGDVVGQAAPDLKTLIAEQVPAMSTTVPPPTLESICAAVRKDDAASVRQQLRQAVGALGPKRFLVELAQPLAMKLGQLWRSGEIAIRQEHLASDLLATQLRLMVTSHEAGQRRPRVILTTLPDEYHGLALEMVALYLAIHHATPLSLGVSTPVREIAAAAIALNADVVGLSISAAANTATVERDTKELFHELPRRVELWLGGQGADELDIEALGATSTTSWEKIDIELRKWHDANER